MNHPVLVVKSMGYIYLRKSDKMNKDKINELHHNSLSMINVSTRRIKETILPSIELLNDKMTESDLEYDRVLDIHDMIEDQLHDVLKMISKSKSSVQARLDLMDSTSYDNNSVALGDTLSDQLAKLRNDQDTYHYSDRLEKSTHKIIDNWMTESDIELSKVLYYKFLSHLSDSVDRLRNYTVYCDKFIIHLKSLKSLPTEIDGHSLSYNKEYPIYLSNSLQDKYGTSLLYAGDASLYDKSDQLKGFIIVFDTHIIDQLDYLKVILSDNKLHYAYDLPEWIMGNRNPDKGHSLTIYFNDKPERIALDDYHN